jgi:ABC-type glycerol-3-phosphate transport system permease component
VKRDREKRDEAGLQALEAQSRVGLITDWTDIFIRFEAATMDGASRLQKILHVTLPGIMPTIVLILLRIIVSVLPLLCIYPFQQRFFVQGVMVGGIKE